MKEEARDVADLSRHEPAATVAAHPDVETWIAYYEGAVEIAESADLRRHLAGCRRCVDLVLDLDAVVRPAAEDRAGVSDFEQAASWRSLRAAIARDAEPAAEHRPPPAVVLRRPGRFGGSRWQAPLAMAASLAVGVLGFSLWFQEHRTAGELRQTLAELAAPRINVPIEDLYPETATRSGGSAEPLTVPAAADFVPLVLNLEEPVAYPDYQVRLRDADGREVWSSAGLVMSEYGNFTLLLSRHFLAPGPYQVELSGLAAGDWKLLQSYTLEIR